MTLSGGTIYQPLTNNGTLTVAGVASKSAAHKQRPNHPQQRFEPSRRIPFAGGFVNAAGGIVEGAGGAISLLSSEPIPPVPKVEVPAGNSLSITNAWTNDGSVSMGGANAVLNGGTITNIASIQARPHQRRGY